MAAKGRIQLHRVLLLIMALLLVATLGLGVTAPKPEVKTISITGVIDPAMADYLERALNEATDSDAAALIIQLNTPGGLGASMDRMTGLLLNSRIPTVVYVSPSGAEAFSAGTFITLAAHFAVMHPDSTIGAAHPRALGAGAAPQPDQSDARSQSDAVMEKITNAYATKARTIAEARRRNGDWAEAAVRRSATATATQALKLKIVDSVQPDLRSVINWLDGKTTRIAGHSVTLHTRGAQLAEIPASLKDNFLHRLADPNLLLILLTLGTMGLLFELQNPGAILPGVVGGISLLLALYSMSVLPVTTTGLALIGFGILLLILDIKLPSHGILTVGGIASFIIGGLMLTDDQTGVGRMSWQVVVTMAVLMGGFFAFAIGAAVRAHMRKPTTGIEGMLGQKGRVATVVSEEAEGEIAVAGELWRARSLRGTLERGEQVEVVGLDGLTLLVQPWVKNELVQSASV